MRATVSDIHDLCAELHLAISEHPTRCGLPEGFRLALDEGSPSAGRAWRLYWMTADSSAHNSMPDRWFSGGVEYTFPAGRSYLGWTKNEAATALRRCVSDVRYMRGG